MKLAKILVSLMLTAAMASALPFSISAQVTANPVISRDCPAYSESSPYTAKGANDSAYSSFWYGSVPDYLAYDLSAVPQEQRSMIVAVWYNSTEQYDYTVLNGGSSSMPTQYTIDVNAASGGDYPQDGWETVVEVSGNTLHSRQHLIDFDGYNWIRIMITEVDGRESGTAGINFDIHNAENGITDSWIFYGDSITSGGMMNSYGTSFAELINELDSDYFPIQENGGIGGIFSTDGAENIDRWLDVFPGKYVSIAYGTNDAWGNQTGAQKYYENTVYMINAVLDAGKIPILPKIPYSTESGINSYLDDYNAMIDKIYLEYPQVIKGPDFEKMFYENPELLGPDGVHPSSEGYAQMRRLWAETMYDELYSDSEIPPVLGDVDGNGIVNHSDCKYLHEFLLGAEYSDSQSMDVNSDGKVDAFDSVYIKAKI